MDLDSSGFRWVLAAAAVAALGFMLLAAALEYSRETGELGEATARADLAAYELRGLMDEARRITADSARALAEGG